MQNDTLEANAAVGILVCSIRIRLLVRFAVFQLFAIFIVSARVPIEYMSCIAGMLNSLQLSISLLQPTSSVSGNELAHLFVCFWPAHISKGAFVNIFRALFELIPSI